MAKRAYTLTIAWPDGSKTHKIALPSWLLYLGGFANLVGIITLVIFLVNFSRMSIKVLEFNRLRSELEGLKTENEMYHASTTQLGEKLWSLEALAEKLSVAVGLEKRPSLMPSSNIRSVTFPVDGAASESLAIRAVLLPELKRLSTSTAGLEGRFLKIDRYYSDQTTRYAHTPNMWPVLGLLWDRFGWRESVSEIGEAEYHNGIDICAPYGCQVLASADGVVALVERRPDYGNLIIINHGSGLTTRYAHLSGFLVSQGEQVKRGQIIGLVGKSGRATGPHLHYEVRLNGNPVNPLRYISKTSKG
jgi:murein DD-endopeptidase MepM/ murein hydrolase activator NlpD